MSEEYRLAIEKALELAEIQDYERAECNIVTMADGLCAAGLPLAAAIAPSSITTGEYAQTIGASVQAALRAVETGPAARDIAPWAVAIRYWLLREDIDRVLSADSELRVQRDSALCDEMFVAMQAFKDNHPLEQAIQRISIGDFAESAVDTPVGWVVHVRCVTQVFAIITPGDTETAVVGYAMRGSIDPEIALGICLWIRICSKIQSPVHVSRARLAAQAPSTAAALAEALERRRPWPALVLPAVII